MILPSLIPVLVQGSLAPVLILTHLVPVLIQGRLYFNIIVKLL